MLFNGYDAELHAHARVWRRLQTDETMCDARLSLRVRGGLSNQRECIVNAGIAAHMLGVPLVLPRLDLIGRGNEQFAPKDAHMCTPGTVMRAGARLACCMISVTLRNSWAVLSGGLMGT